MSDFQRQFVLYIDGRKRWRWFLYDAGMKPVACAYGSYRTYEECVLSTRLAAGVARNAVLWDAENQRWDESANDPAPVRSIC